jgi:hypothetical protein
MGMTPQREHESGGGNGKLGMHETAVGSWKVAGVLFQPLYFNALELV